MENQQAFHSTLNHLTTSMFHFCRLLNNASYCYGYSTLEQRLYQITVQYNKSKSVKGKCEI